MAESQLMLFPEAASLHNKCSRCLKYLSIGPIMITTNKEIICGRCVDMDSALPSLYNYIAKEFVYKCVNHFEGCDILLNFNEAEEHEKTCKGKTYTCPLCNFEGLCVQLIGHFKRSHPQSVITNNTFRIVINEDHQRHYLFIKNTEHIFMINVSIEKDELSLSQYSLSVSDLTPSFNLSLTHTQIIGIEYNMDAFKHTNVDKNSAVELNKWTIGLLPIRNLFGSVNYVLCRINLMYVYEDFCKYRDLTVQHEKILKQENECVLWEQSLLKNNMKLQISMQTYKFLTKFLLDKMQLPVTCVSCKCKIITNEIYRCTNSHLYCKNCLINECSGNSSAEDINWKPKKLEEISGKKCKECLSDLVSKLELEGIGNIPCVWDNCTESIHLPLYFNHKRDCAFRVVDCPAPNCKWAGKLKDLSQHWHCEEPKLICNEILKFNCPNSTATYGIFWIKPSLNELFYFNYSRDRFIIKENWAILQTYYKYYVHGPNLSSNGEILGGIKMHLDRSQYYFIGNYSLQIS